MSAIGSRRKKENKKGRYSDKQTHQLTIQCTRANAFVGIDFLFLLLFALLVLANHQLNGRWFDLLILGLVIWNAAWLAVHAFCRQHKSCPICLHLVGLLNLTKKKKKKDEEEEVEEPRPKTEIWFDIERTDNGVDDNFWRKWMSTIGQSSPDWNDSLQTSFSSHFVRLRDAIDLNIWSQSKREEEEEESKT